MIFYGCLANTHVWRRRMDKKANKKNKKIYDPKFPGIEKELYIVCVHIIAATCVER
jgi:hypothetical protein